jgi:hypothetical protein
MAGHVQVCIGGCAGLTTVRFHKSERAAELICELAFSKLKALLRSAPSTPCATPSRTYATSSTRNNAATSSGQQDTRPINCDTLWEFKPANPHTC